MRQLVGRGRYQTGAQLGQQPDLGQLVGADPQPLHLLAQPGRGVDGVGPGDRVDRPQRAVGLEHVAPLGELGEQQPAQFRQAAAPGEQRDEIAAPGGRTPLA